MENPLQSELRKVEARAAAESMLLAVNADQIDAVYALAKYINSRIDDPYLQVEATVTPHTHSDCISTIIFVRRHQEKTVCQALFDLGIEATVTEPLSNIGSLTFNVENSGCKLVYVDQQSERRAA